MTNIREINTLEKLNGAMANIPDKPIPVPMELLDAQSQAALQGWCIGKGLEGAYTLALVPAEGKS